MVDMFNSSGFVGLLIINFTNNVTGDIFLTLFALMFAVFLFFLAMRLPIELTAILMVPLFIVYLAYGGGDWKPVVGVFLLYLSIIFGRFFLR